MFEDTNRNSMDELAFRLGKLVEQYPECDWLQEFAQMNKTDDVHSLLSTTIDIDDFETFSVIYLSDN